MQKPSRNRFDKMDWFIKIHDKIRRLVLLDYSYCDQICYKIKYFVSEESGFTDSINHNFTRVKICSCDSLTIDFS